MQEADQRGRRLHPDKFQSCLSPRVGCAIPQTSDPSSNLARLRCPTLHRHGPLPVGAYRDQPAEGLRERVETQEGSLYPALSNLKELGVNVKSKVAGMDLP